MDAVLAGLLERMFSTTSTVLRTEHEQEHEHEHEHEHEQEQEQAQEQEREREHERCCFFSYSYSYSTIRFNDVWYSEPDRLGETVVISLTALPFEK
jgi:ABC-type Zn2+ transport system substrate-binding protein/surface adhesin